METIGYIWTEEHFKEGNNTIYKVRSLSYPHIIALIQVNPHKYTVYMGEYKLKLGEIIMVYKLAKACLDDYNRYSS